MNKTIFAAFAGIVIIATGCVRTVSDTNTFAVTPSRDTVAGRYNRSIDQVYKASYNVVSHNGIIVREYVPHDYTNVVRQLEGRVNDCKVFVRVEQIDAKVSEVDVEARTKWGVSDLDLVHELEKEIALELSGD